MIQTMVVITQIEGLVCLGLGVFMTILGDAHFGLGMALFGIGIIIAADYLGRKAC